MNFIMIVMNFIMIINMIFIMIECEKLEFQNYPFIGNSIKKITQWHRNSWNVEIFEYMFHAFSCFNKAKIIIYKIFQKISFI